MVVLIAPGDDRLLDATRVGHKFARQERLRRAGFPVPPFFCLPVAAFDAVARDLPSPPPDATEPELTAWAADGAARLAAAELPPRAVAAIVDAATALVGEHGRLAVRACVVAGADGTGEDGATDAFAGLTESHLYVPVPDVPRRIVGCWASALSPQSILYRHRRGVAPEAARVAVGVQLMVPGTRSFVAFSRDPRTGTSTRVVAAGHGIGEGVVQERADVDHFFVDIATGAVRAELVTKRRMVGPGDDGPVTVAVPAELAEPPVLTDDEVHRVSGLAAGAEAYFGVPQDIEGTITPDGTVHLVQARPVVFAAAGPTLWSNHNITESFPKVSGALTYSQARVFYRLIFRDVYRRMGVSESRLRRQEHHLNRMVGLLDGRIYYRLDAWFALHGQLPGFVLVRPWWERSMGLTGYRRPSRAAVLRALCAVPGLAVRLALLPGSVRRFLRWWDRLVDDSADIDRWGPDELVTFYRRLWAEVGHRWGVTLVNTFFMLGWATLVSALLRRWVAGDGERLLGGMLAGGQENRSVLGIRSAIALAELVGADPALSARVEACGDSGETAEAIWDDMVAGRYGAAVAAAAGEHLRRFGDRALHDLKLEEPSPRQRPAMIVTMIKPLVQAGLTVAGSRASEQVGREEADRLLREQCAGPLRRAVLRGVVAGLRWFVKTREDTRYCRGQLFGLTRQVTWRLGDLLARADRLDAPTDAVDLTVEELLGAFDGTLIDVDLRAVVRRRRRERQAAAGRADLPVEVTTPAHLPVAAGLPDRVTVRPRSAAGTDLRGLPSTGGFVRGRARVVLDPSVAAETCRDRIIVAKETDPGWLLLMMAARGMVVERGTMLSHTAITGRLLGIPTVVAVPDATSLIPDDAELELDGAAGLLRVVDAGRPA